MKMINLEGLIFLLVSSVLNIYNIDPLGCLSLLTSSGQFTLKVCMCVCRKQGDACCAHPTETLNNIRFERGETITI